MDVLSALQRRHGDLVVQISGGDDVHKVNIFFFQQLPVVGVAAVGAEVHRGIRLRHLLQIELGSVFCLELPLVDVADRHQLYGNTVLFKLPVYIVVASAHTAQADQCCF